MADCFVGEIKIFAGNFAPQGWAFCDGSLVSVAENTTLFALLGTTYGGDGRNTFGLPDLRGRLPVHMGQGPGLTNRYIGQQLGYEKSAVTADQLASHTHGLESSSGPAATDNPDDKMLGQSTGKFFAATAAQTTSMHSESISSTGSGQSHENVMPSLCLNFIIALEGDFPPRN